MEIWEKLKIGDKVHYYFPFPAKGKDKMAVGRVTYCSKHLIDVKLKNGKLALSPEYFQYLKRVKIK